MADKTEHEMAPDPEEDDLDDLDGLLDEPRCWKLL